MNNIEKRYWPVEKHIDAKRCCRCLGALLSKRRYPTSLGEDPRSSAFQNKAVHTDWMQLPRSGSWGSSNSTSAKIMQQQQQAGGVQGALRSAQHQVMGQGQAGSSEALSPPWRRDSQNSPIPAPSHPAAHHRHHMQGSSHSQLPGHHSSQGSSLMMATSQMMGVGQDQTELFHIRGHTHHHDDHTEERCAM
jgi:hypothetical protein